ARNDARRVPRRRRRLVPLALLSRQLERGIVQRPGHHRGGAGDLRTLEPDAVLLGVAPVRRRRGARPGAGVGGLEPGLLSLHRRALHSDPADHHHDLLAEAHPRRRPGRAEHHQIEPRRPMPEHYVKSDPYPWPYNGDLRPANTALIIIDMQTDFCGVGGYVDKMGYHLSLTRAPIEPIK